MNGNANRLLLADWSLKWHGFLACTVSPAARWSLALARLRRRVDPCHGPGSRIPVGSIRTQLHADPRPLGTLIPPVIPKPPACGGSDPGSAGSATAKGLIAHECTYRPPVRYGDKVLPARVNDRN